MLSSNETTQPLQTYSVSGDYMESLDFHLLTSTFHLPTWGGIRQKIPENQDCHHCQVGMKLPAPAV